jgi:hypothetical protein
LVGFISRFALLRLFFVELGAASAIVAPLSRKFLLGEQRC